ncbi:hypothetical protein RSC3_01973 [Bacillus paralicheniformis]|nr:hypothetical protein RSC3_01973 [Bacillus paralicheniformis]
MGDWTGVLRLSAEEKNGKTIAKNVYFQGRIKSCVLFIMMNQDKPVIIF